MLLQVPVRRSDFEQTYGTTFHLNVVDSNNDRLCFKNRLEHVRELNFTNIKKKIYIQIVTVNFRLSLSQTSSFNLNLVINLQRPTLNDC